MTSYTGTQKVFRGPESEWMKTMLQRITDGCMTKRSAATYWEPIVFKMRIAQTTAAIATDDYTYTVFHTPRAMVIMGCWIVEPVGLSVDATNYNTFELIQSATTVCSKTSAYGLIANLPVEIPLANTLANRTLVVEEDVTLKITGTAAGRIIHEGTEVWVVCRPA